MIKLILHSRRHFFRGFSAVFMLALLFISLFMASWENMLSLSKESPVSRRFVSNTNQRVVILAGPHKTASSSIQLNLYHWLNVNSTQEDIAVFLKVELGRLAVSL